MFHKSYNGSWTRSKNDKEVMNADLKQSTAPIQYQLDPCYSERCHPCLATENGWIGKQGVSYDPSRPVIDVESELRNLGRPLNRDTSTSYQPQCLGSNKKCQQALYHFPICQIKNEHTRLSNPVSTLKETGVNRFQPLCLNPQDPERWEHPGEIGINTRLYVKDTYIPRIPRLIDQSALLPNGKTK